ncbi:Dual specificity protein phosphatase 22 [Homalodisca vitripennis]|nr:Dual specificity protein phosphatase 22 [Homalodisca vitripennis]
MKELSSGMEAVEFTISGKDKHYLCVMAADTPDQNLTQYFPLCNDFIHAARLRGGNVLIHWAASYYITDAFTKKAIDLENSVEEAEKSRFAFNSNDFCDCCMRDMFSMDRGHLLSTIHEKE